METHIAIDESEAKKGELTVYRHPGVTAYMHALPLTHEKK